MHAYQPDRLVSNQKKTGFIQSMLSEHPALLGGALLSVVTTGAIFANAVLYQPDLHPSPMFKTRAAVEKPVSIKKAKAVKRKKKKAVVQVAKNDASTEILREVQSALAVRGYYGGKVDGKYGSRTKKAVVTFQQDHSLKQDGVASVQLLTRILLSASATPQEVPVPRVQNIAVAPQVEKTVTATVEPKARPAVMTTAVETKQITLTQTASVTPTETVTEVAPKPKSEANSGLVARIQVGLRAYGYDELVVDGKPGKQTSDAIQSFQLDYGMKITGEPSETVLNKLQEIGAYKQG